MTRTPNRAIIDLDAVRHNVGVIQRYAGAARVIGVVKADAYGHGVLPVARTVLDAGAAFLGVCHIDEALALRAGGITAPVISWLHVPDDAYADAVAADVDLGVSSVWELDQVTDAAVATGHQARVHLKIDTGLGRNGATPEDWPELVRHAAKAQAGGRVKVVGQFSHLSCADEPEDPSNAEAGRRFQAAYEVMVAEGVPPEVRHLSNSPALFALPELHFNLVRPGLALYGLSPFEGRPHTEFGLRPAMTLEADVAAVKHVPAGQGVSYGLTYRTEAPTTLALIPVGYADGIPRSTSGRGVVQIRGRRYTQVGKVAMDQFVVDLHTEHSDVVPGDRAVLWSDGRDGEPTVDDWAAAAGTINYEMVTRIGTRVPRVYRGGAQAGPARV